MKLCLECAHGRVCGNKEHYKIFVAEMNELHDEVGDHFPKNPVCPEFLNLSAIEVRLDKNATEGIEEDVVNEAVECDTDKGYEFVESFRKLGIEVGTETITILDLIYKEFDDSMDEMAVMDKSIEFLQSIGVKIDRRRSLGAFAGAQFEEFINELKEEAGDNLFDVVAILSMVETKDEVFNEFKDMAIGMLSLELLLNDPIESTTTSSCDCCRGCLEDELCNL